jgi:hypothetical protein
MKVYALLLLALPGLTLGQDRAAADATSAVIAAHWTVVNGRDNSSGIPFGEKMASHFMQLSGEQMVGPEYFGALVQERFSVLPADREALSSAIRENTEYL